MSPGAPHKHNLLRYLTLTFRAMGRGRQVGCRQIKRGSNWWKMRVDGKSTWVLTAYGPVVGSQPVTKSELSASSFAMSAAERVNAYTWAFDAMRAGVTDLGSVT